MKPYRSYSFIEKDPVINVVRTIVEDSRQPWSTISEESGVTRGTIRNWFLGSTKRPQFATVAAVTRACGYNIRIGAQTIKPNGKGKR